ncbi:phosphoenolpyruvate--protein phosphotransferase [Methylopila jiangsuensis]|uniref:phosphoenolpyruvate--protein phosphotransferase n=1 Tax=Methylopila jiangsuensis TaxID=586230 RepID=A0A9W6N250_9HYPH|nr:phosphoenolpyruvate--protein phosphotransferase [Methylopila jiangsuensis]MDR6287179.1 phosphotransferase system enzyme I (PtsP) [Methylopila jiangsuensis]GLK74861.1 phosphoenolpyruvate--protein phosphotransferase [Methylopila jiangsuensis]
MRGAYGGPRVLLRRLREVMAEPVTAQERLDRIVVLIAANMVAEVCSVYVLRVDGDLELYATEGLNRDAVHRTTMRKGEGLVGLVADEAEPVNLADAQAHPAYSYKPETGEEIYHSFMGVPILRSGNTLGVLVVQNKAHRSYSDEEIEALQTTAMVIAEMIASGELAPPGGGVEPVGRRPAHAGGAPLSEGIGLGHVVLHEPRVVVKNLIAEDSAAELKRLDAALARLRASIDVLLDEGDVARAGEHRDVLEAFRMFANDRGWGRRLHEAVLTGLTAEAAVERVQSDTRARMQRQTDPYLRERLHDLDDLANRLLRELTSPGLGMAPAVAELPENAIVVARSMGPAALLDYDRSRLRGLVLEEGSGSSHVAIVARALGIAAVGQLENATGLVEAGDAIIVDGVSGEVHVRPTPDVERAYADKVRFRARRQEQYRALREKPTRSQDGVDVSLYLNAGLLVDLPHIEETGADGVGLFRTELQFMVATSLPKTAAQEALYRSVLEAARGKPVTFRTLDVGGDKVLPYMSMESEENPALGWRAIRLGLDRPALLRTQVRAMLRAAAGRELRIMFPMVAAVSEFDEAVAVVQRERARLDAHGHRAPTSMSLGVMVEVPSLLFQLDEIARKADFLSVGSNDLMQFLYAADRGNPRIANRFDPLSRGFLRSLRAVARAGAKHGTPVTLCGEMAARPLEAMALLAVGYRAMSVSPAAVGPVKTMLLSLDVAEAASVVEPLIDAEDGPSCLRPALQAYAAKRGLPVEP